MSSRDRNRLGERNGLDRCSADEWVAMLCDLVPSITDEGLLLYLELIVAADHEGRVQIDLDAVSARVFGTADRRATAHALRDLRHVQLPADDSPYRSSTRSWLVASMSVRLPPDASPEPRGLDALGFPLALLLSPVAESPDFIDGMVAHGHAAMLFVRFGAGFGSSALPGDYPLAGGLADRRSWAQRMRDEARARAPRL